MAGGATKRERSDAILALDAARVLGWAYGVPGETPIAGSVALASAGAGNGLVGKGLLIWMADFLTINPVGSIYIEAPIDPRHMGGRTSFDTARALIGIVYLIETIAETKNIFRVREGTLADVRKNFLGKQSNMKREDWKRATMARCAQLGWKYDGDNAADALSLWAYACSIEAPKAAIQTGPLFLPRTAAVADPIPSAGRERSRARAAAEAMFRRPTPSDDIEDIPL